eukprot:5930892-Prymnesium_polylepis.2
MRRPSSAETRFDLRSSSLPITSVSVGPVSGFRARYAVRLADERCSIASLGRGRSLCSIVRFTHAPAISILFLVLRSRQGKQRVQLALRYPNVGHGHAVSHSPLEHLVLVPFEVFLERATQSHDGRSVGQMGSCAGKELCDRQEIGAPNARGLRAGGEVSNERSTVSSVRYCEHLKSRVSLPGQK